MGENYELQTVASEAPLLLNTTLNGNSLLVFFIPINESKNNAILKARHRKVNRGKELLACIYFILVYLVSACSGCHCPFYL